ncbi:sensor histidine kinase [Radiobacillus sp. PE A8.2]|uniref:cache domain-containing sensor histidine kinase n=1 Tax=Radiobacillus sp. PE A8.2 TaxID=3380349 RepID=UPI003890A949
MLLLISFILFAFSIGGLAILQHAFHVYNQEIYRQTAQSLSVSSNSIENELKNMERLSYQVATDIYVQTYLSRLRNSENEFEEFLIGVDLRKRLLEIGGLKRHVESLQVYDSVNQEYSSGNHIVMLRDERLEQIKEKTALQKGGVEWIYPDDTDSALIAARQARYYFDLSFEPIGMIAVRMNLSDIVGDFSNSLNEKNAQLAIFDEHDRQIYPIEDQLSKVYTSGMESAKGYNLVKDQGERYFITYSPARHTKWTYMIVTPYDSMFHVISTARFAVIALYILLFIVLFIMGMRFVSGITEPIESLNKKMEKVQTGNLNLDIDDSIRMPLDETGQMHDNFKKMMNQINQLISENYKKQLAIKDSEFKTLQAQVNPHFLYNTLESINWSAKMEGHQKISRMAESLGFILHASINMKESVIPLQKELTIVESYITIQSYRFEERLVFHTDIPNSILHCIVPKFVLQPLVENSIRYGLQRMVGTCTISIIAKQVGDNIQITVEDNGPGMDQVYLAKLLKGDYEPQGTGIGLKNINDRIELLLGSQYGIEIESEKNYGTKVHITLPYESEGDHVQSVISR